MKLVSRIAGLSGREARLLVRALSALAWLRLALPFASVTALHRRSLRIAADPHARYGAADAAWAVQAVARRIPGTHCLPRALALHGLLRRAGLEPSLRFGIARAQGGAGVAAHAWVECAGVPVGDPADIGTRYAPFEGAIPRGAYGR